MKLLRTVGLAAAAAVLLAAPALAQDSKSIPPEAAELLKPLPISPRGQVVPGYPEGAPASSPDVLKLSDQDIADLKAKHFTAAIVMHTMDAGWPRLQVAGIKATLKEYGIDVVAVTNAQFKPGQQISDLTQVVARKPDVIFSIPIDPESEAGAYKKVAAAGIKLVFMDNVPPGLKPGKDYISVVASDNEKNAYYAAQELVKAIGGKGEVGLITLVYDSYYSVAVRKVGAEKAFKEHPGIKLVDVGTFTTPEKAYGVATAMLTAHPNIKGIYVAWDTPAEQVIAAEKTLGRNIVVTTNDLAQDSALYVARGDFLAIGAQRPYDQGVAEAKAAALGLLGKSVPPYIEVPTLRVKKLDLLSALKLVTKEPAPKSVVDACKGECY